MKVFGFGHSKYGKAVLIEGDRRPEMIYRDTAPCQCEQMRNDGILIMSDCVGCPGTVSVYGHSSADL